jgi:hypothetical protein
MALFLNPKFNKALDPGSIGVKAIANLNQMIGLSFYEA